MMLKKWRSLQVGLATILAMGLLTGGLAWAKKPPKPPPEPPPEPPAYSYKSLGNLGGSFSVAEGMNEQGDVVGWARTMENRQHAFLWTESDGMVDLNNPTSLAGWHAGSYLQSALDINDNGKIVGGAYLNGTGAAYVYSPGAPVVDMTPIVVAGMGGDGDDLASAEVINNSGDIAGDFVTVPGNYNDGYLLLGDTGEVIPIGLVNGRRTHAKCITNRVDGVVQVSGVSVEEGSIIYHAFRFTYDTVSGIGLLEDLESVRSRSWSSGEGINDLGDVVGLRSTNKGYTAFRYTDDSGIENLGTLGNIYSEARAINIFGDVVGWSQTDDYWVNRGFLSTDEHGMLDLEELVIDRLPDELGYMQPGSINTAGQISGNIRTYDSSFDEAFLLTPVSE
jgi:probable HAF family extracellular repeat protein